MLAARHDSPMHQPWYTLVPARSRTSAVSAAALHAQTASLSPARRGARPATGACDAGLVSEEGGTGTVQPHLGRLPPDWHRRRANGAAVTPAHDARACDMEPYLRVYPRVQRSAFGGFKKASNTRGSLESKVVWSAMETRSHLRQLRQQRSHIVDTAVEA